MTMVLGMWHFSFTVADIERSIGFYRDVLGLTLVHQQDQSNDYTRRLVGYPDAELRIAQLAIPGQDRRVSTHDLELVQYTVPYGEPFGPDRYRPGASHLALCVRDAKTEHARLTRLGVAFVSEPQQITAGVNRGGFTCYFLDPDDITLELVQPPADRLP